MSVQETKVKRTITFYSAPDIESSSDSSDSDSSDDHSPDNGYLSAFSETVQWTIPNFLSLEKFKGEYVQSPRFTMSGCTWHLRVYPAGCDIPQGGYCGIFLHKDDPKAKKVTFSIGIKTDDGIAHEGKMSKTFNEESLSWGWCDFIDLDTLHSLKSELAPLGALTLTCSVHYKVRTLDPDNEDVTRCGQDRPGPHQESDWPMGPNPSGMWTTTSSRRGNNNPWRSWQPSEGGRWTLPPLAFEGLVGPNPRGMRTLTSSRRGNQIRFFSRNVK